MNGEYEKYKKSWGSAPRIKTKKAIKHNYRSAKALFPSYIPESTPLQYVLKIFSTRLNTYNQ
jgi:hypothetical protein